MGRGEKKQMSAAHANERKDWRLIQSDAGPSKLCYLPYLPNRKNILRSFLHVEESLKEKGD